MNAKILFLVCLLSPCAFSKDMVIFLKPGQSSFTVELKSNPTTGYRWDLLEYNRARLNLEQSTYKQSEPVLIGSGGYQKFNIKVVQPKATVDEWLTFKYARSWEPKSGLKQRVHVLTHKNT